MEAPEPTGQTTDCPIHLGQSADTSHLYSVEVPGRDHLRSKPTQINEFAVDHIIRDHPERLDWLPTHLDAIRKAVGQPQLIYARPEYKGNMKHWTQCHAIEYPEGSERYLMVVISLAALEGSESEFHQVITVFPTQKRKFYNSLGDLRPKWLLYRNAD